MKKTKVAVITGIDGAGKSTLIARLHEDFKVNPAIKVFACPSFHHIPGSGVDELSIIFEKINVLGNTYHNYDLKALGLYLQMSLYSSVIRRHSESLLVSFIISERHALVDTMVYGPLYSKAISGQINQQRWEPIIKAELNKLDQQAFAKVEEWIDKLNNNNPRDYSFWNYTGLIKEIFAREDNVLSRLSNLYMLDLPDQICFLKTDPEIAIQRLKGRNKQLELHEISFRLNELQEKYLLLLQQIRTTFPNIRIDLLENSSYDELVQCIHPTLNPVDS